MKHFYKHFLTILLIYSVSFSVFAQNMQVLKGTVLDKDGVGVPYANVYLKNSIIGTICDVEGNFSLSLASTNSVLSVSAFGFQTKEIDAKIGEYLRIQLEDSYSTLDEVVAVGYGTLQKSVITGAISSVKNSAFRDQPVVAVGNAVQGKLAGVNVVSPSGTPGAGLLFNVRGSFNPLYVVDGIPLLSENNSSLETSYDLSGNAVGRGQSVSSIADINPNDIESIEILKDASAAAIYGARAANGVVLITTKRGNSERTEFGINQYVGIQERTRSIDFMSSSEMLDLLKEGLAQDKAIYEKDNTAFDDNPNFDPRIFDGNFSEGFNTQNNTVWLDEVLNQAPIYNTEVYARGGNARTRFHISGNYFNQSGILLNSGFKRMSARINLDHQVNDRFSIGNTLMLSRSNNQRTFNDNTYTGIITNAIGASPFLTPFTKDGDYTAIDINDGLGAYASWLSDNPVKSANEIRANTITNRVIGSFFGEYKINNNLRFKSSWSLDYTDMVDNQYFSPITYDAIGVKGRALFSNYKATNWVAENYLTYTKTIAADHNFTAIVGNSVQSAQARRIAFQGENFANIDEITQITAAGQIIKRPPLNSALGIVSYYSRVNYDFKNRILLAASLRLDGSSRFAKENRYATLGSTSLGFRIISDSDPQSTSLLTDLKARISYGITGDQEIGDFNQANYYGVGLYDGNSTVVPVNLANPNLTWQKNRILNVGLDFELKKGRIAGAIEGFVANKSGLLFPSRVPGTTGFSSIVSNAGTIQSRGLEFTLNSTLVNHSRFRWNIATNFSLIQNEYTDLAEDDQIISAYSDISPTHIAKVGYPVGTFWGIKYEGVDPATGDALFEDLNNDGEIDSDDSQILGRAFPTVYGGITTDLKYKRFDLSIATQFSLGNQVYNLIRPIYNNGGWLNDGWEEVTDENGNTKIVISSFYANNGKNMDKRWKKPGDVTDIPRASLLTQNYIDASSMFIEDASFLRIRTINLGYNLKNTKWFNAGRLYLQIQNPFLFTRYSGFDPEVSSTGGSIGAEQTAGVDYGAYPQSRAYTFGINLTF